MAKQVPSPDQVRAFDAKAKLDLFSVIEQIIPPGAVERVGRFLSENPDNIVSQVLSHPVPKSMITIAAQRAKQYREQEVAKAEEAARKRQPER
jgi:hypothetical protein